MHKIGRNINFNEEATITVVPTVDDNAITLSTPNKRHWFAITCENESGWIRFMPAATDPAGRKGMRFIPGQTKIFPIDDVYRGEISCINDKDGKTPIFHITEMVDTHT